MSTSASSTIQRVVEGLRSGRIDDDAVKAGLEQLSPESRAQIKQIALVFEALDDDKARARRHALAMYLKVHAGKAGEQEPAQVAEKLLAVIIPFPVRAR